MLAAAAAAAALAAEAAAICIIITIFNDILFVVSINLSLIEESVFSIASKETNEAAIIFLITESKEKIPNPRCFDNFLVVEVNSLAKFS